jgi:hypothetical protein
MSLKHAALTAAAFAPCAGVNPMPAAAQAPNCANMYNGVMQLYQTAPQSLEYAQMAAIYSASCVGSSADPIYPLAAGLGYSGPPTDIPQATLLRATFTGHRSESDLASAAAAGVAESVQSAPTAGAARIAG